MTKALIEWVWFTFSPIRDCEQCSTCQIQSRQRCRTQEMSCGPESDSVLLNWNDDKSWRVLYFLMSWPCLIVFVFAFVCVFLSTIWTSLPLQNKYKPSMSHLKSRVAKKNEYCRNEQIEFTPYSCLHPLLLLVSNILLTSLVRFLAYRLFSFCKMEAWPHGFWFHCHK